MFTWLKPVVDGFRNYVDDGFAAMAPRLSPEEMFLDKANLLTLTAPEWVVLTGGLRALNANHDGSNRGIFTDRVGVLTTDFFRTLTDTNLVWEKADAAGTTFALEGPRERAGQVRGHAQRPRLRVERAAAQHRRRLRRQRRPAALRGATSSGSGTR